jgi:hypothetical protein
MVYKVLKIITALSVAVLIPISAMAGSRTLCDLFGEEGGFFQIFYDLRRVNPGDTILQNPMGGIKFELSTAQYETKIERDAFLKKIKRVVFYNMTTGDKYILRSPDPYTTALGDFGAEYVLHIGNTRLVLGDWKVIVYQRGGKYEAYFTITC